MGLLQEIGALAGGGTLERLASGQGNFQDPASPDQQNLHNMIGRAEPGQLQQVFSQAATQMNPQEYATHITSGAGGTNPLGALGGGGLATIASALMSHLTGSGGLSAGSLLSKIPGLQTTDPNQMDANQVASVAQYTQQNHPDIFGRVASQIGQQQPSLLNSFVGKAGLALGAAALASHFIKMG
jgi:pyridoxal biosynthesis lyase PdxS